MKNQLKVSRAAVLQSKATGKIIPIPKMQVLSNSSNKKMPLLVGARSPMASQNYHPVKTSRRNTGQVNIKTSTKSRNRMNSELHKQVETKSSSRCNFETNCTSERDCTQMSFRNGEALC